MLKKKPAKVIIFSQGDEVVTGALVDTNAAWLSEQCRLLGFDIIRHISVPDNLNDLVEVIQQIDGLADVCLCTGGLGPTDDDLTTEAFCAAFNIRLELDHQAMAMMSEFFNKLKIQMAEVNKKQAYLPKDSTRIDNLWGTAAGFVSKGERCRFYFMPGVPYEMKNMMESFVLRDLESQFRLPQTTLVTLRSIDIGESTIQQIINEIDLESDIRISFRAGLPENELKLIFPVTYTNEQMQRCVRRVKDALGEGVFAVDGLSNISIKNLPDLVGQLMEQQGLSLGVLETLSQGQLAHQCSAAWLKESSIIPNVEAVIERFDLPNLLNEEVVVKLAQHQRALFETDLALVQLYENINEQSLRIWTAIASADGSLFHTSELWGRSHRQQLLAASAAFNLLRKKLQHALN